MIRVRHRRPTANERKYPYTATGRLQVNPVSIGGYYTEHERGRFAKGRDSEAECVYMINSTIYGF